MNHRNFKIGIVLTLICFFFNTVSIFAQQSKVGNWFVYFGNQKISSKWNWWNEVQLRNYDFLGDVQQLLLRTGVGYDLEENKINILMGYAHISTYNYQASSENKVVSNENRIYQQLTLKNRYGRIYLSHRYRSEERFFRDDFKFRFRYFLSCNIPITKSTMAKQAFYASLYNEIFLQVNDPYFDRNRLYGALGYVISPDLRIEMGYMNQSLAKTSRNQFQIVLFNNISLSKE